MSEINSNRLRNKESLLSLENKLNAYSVEERTASKFILKPEISKPHMIFEKPSLIQNIASFMQDFKNSNDELFKDEKLVKAKNIENGERKQNTTPCIKMNLGLGVLELKKIPNVDSQEKNESLNINLSITDKLGTSDMINEELINFLLYNTKDKKKRRIKLRKNAKNNYNK
jgi:hypothetical protein